MKELEVIEKVKELSGKLIMDKELIEAYAKTLGYTINLDEEFNQRFQHELRVICPVVNYMYNETINANHLRLSKVTNLPNVMLFAICNPEIYMVNRFYNVIEKINDKKQTIKIERCERLFNELLSCFKISYYLVEKQGNGKCVYHFDEENFNKVKSIIMYSNVYTTKAINGINDACKEAAKECNTYFEILNLIMEEDELFVAFPYINKYLLKQALKS